MDDFSKDHKLQQWFNFAELSPRTCTIYLLYMKMFCKVAGKTPTELIDEAIKETKQGLLLTERKTVIYFSTYKKYLIDEDYAPKTYALAISTIRAFYTAYDIQLSSSIGKVKKALPLRENQIFLAKKDIIKLLKNARNKRDRAIILCMATSGMARQEILNLKIRDIIFVTIKKIKIGIVSVRRQKSQTDYVTFISPETVQALEEYFKERNKDPSLKIKSGSDYVFISGRGGQMSRYTFNDNFHALGMRCGYENKGYLIKSRSHNLRKFFATTLENAGMAKYKIDFMLGHSQSGNDLAYFKIDVKKLKQLYLKYLSVLTFKK